MTIETAKATLLIRLLKRAAKLNEAKTTQSGACPHSAFSISQAEVKILTRLDRPLPAECLRSVESLSALVGCPVSSACSLQKARHDMQMGLVMMVVISRLNENIMIMVVVMMATISYLPGRIKDCLASGLGMSRLCPDPCSPTSSAAAGATLH